MTRQQPQIMGSTHQTAADHDSPTTIAARPTTSQSAHPAMRFLVAARDRDLRCRLVPLTRTASA